MFQRFKLILDFYRQGFRSMRLGRTLWAVILIKLVVLYTLARVLLPDHLQERFSTDRERATYVLGQLTERSPHP
jgi:Domain of unknown function (DUF4492)